MMYLPRSLHVFGAMMMAVGVLCLYLSRGTIPDILPPQWFQSTTALVIFGTGALLITMAFVLRPNQQHLSPRPAYPNAPDDDDEPFLGGVASDDVPDAPTLRDPQEEQQSLEKSRVCLRPVWPQRTTDSWVGGLPNLPDGMDWPSFNGRPASFLAQISLEGLPDTLWEGFGPRHGSLAFFADPDHRASIAVRHVTEPSTLRQQPHGVVQNWDAQTQPAALVDGTGQRHGTPPRWYLEVSDIPHLGAAEDIELSSESHWDDEKGTYVWEPTWPIEACATLQQVASRNDLRHGIDWPSFFGAWGCWQDWLKHRAASVESRMAANPKRDALARTREAEKLAELEDAVKTNPQMQGELDKHRAEIARMEDRRTKRARDLGAEHAQMARILPKVLELNDTLRKLSAQRAFDPRYAEALAQSMQEVDEKLAKARAVTAQAHMQRDLPQVLETYARNIYAQDPEALPDKLYDLFAPIWETQARETVLFMGRAQPDDDQATPPHVRLIDMPPNPLTGVTFGDMSRFYVDLPASALEAEDWSKAVSTDTHGL